VTTAIEGTDDLAPFEGAPWAGHKRWECPAKGCQYDSVDPATFRRHLKKHKTETATAAARSKLILPGDPGFSADLRTNPETNGGKQ
jgi:hypothetical protein